MTNKTCDLSNVCVGDTLVLRCGGRVVITSYDVDMVYHHNNGWTRDAGSYCDTETNEFDVVAIEKKPHEPTAEEKAFKEGYEKGKKVGQLIIQRRIKKQLENELVQAERAFEAKYGKEELQKLKLKHKY